MSSLTLSVDSMQLVITAEDLSRHPDSLLSSLIASMTSETVAAATSSVDPTKSARTNGTETATPCTSKWPTPVSGGWGVDLEAMDFPVKHEFTTLDLTAAATLLHTFYKEESIPRAVLEPLLNSCANSASGSECSKNDASLHGDMAKLLDYFNIPGPVTRWLPPVESLSLHQWRLLRFIYTCHAVEGAKSVVDTMMAYKPHQDPKQPWHTAVFAVFGEGESGNPSTGVTVHVINSPYLELLDLLENKTNHVLMADPAASKVHQYDYGVVDDYNFRAEQWSPVDTNGSMHPTVYSLCLLLMRRGRPIGPNSCDLGAFLVSGLRTYVRGTTMIFGHVGLNCLRNGHRHTLSAWVLRW